MGPPWAGHGLSNASLDPGLIFMPISDLRSIVICVEVTIRSVFGGLGS